jgi:hypothetical protein
MNVIEFPKAARILPRPIVVVVRFTDRTKEFQFYSHTAVDNFCERVERLGGTWTIEN